MPQSVITPKTITRKQAQRLVKLLEREARCEIMARLGKFNNLEYADYAIKQIEYKDKIRKMLFGTSELVQLAKQWDMFSRRERL